MTGKMTGPSHFVWVPSRDRTHESDFGLLEQNFQFGPLKFPFTPRIYFTTQSDCEVSSKVTVRISEKYEFVQKIDLPGARTV